MTWRNMWPAPCADCGVHTREIDEWYHVHEPVWAEAGMEPLDGFLCIGCLETRLGRQLTPADFSDAAINQVRRSARLNDRLGRADAET